MKGIDIFCASQASTAICLSMDHASSSTAHLGGRAIDRHNPIIRDGKRFTRTLPTAPCSSSEPPPINPTPYHRIQNPNITEKSSSSKHPNTNQNKKNNSADKKKKKSSSSSSSKPLTDVTKDSSIANAAVVNKDCYTAMPADIKKKSCAPLGDFITPPGSSRYLLSDAAFFDGLSDYDPVLALVPAEPQKKLTVNSNRDESSASKSALSSRSEKPSSSQVVVLSVSLHCRGCEGKVRKHLSRMKGVSSFNIDFAAKKVTVVGDVTPLSVLATISKVKNAQFWPAPAPTPSATAAVVSGNNLEIKK